MSSHTSTPEAYTSCSRLMSCLSRYFYVVVVGIALIVVGIVALTGAYPRHTPDSLLAADILRFTPLLLTVSLLMVFGALLLPWLLAKGESRTTSAKLDYRHHFAPLLCFGLGYANLLLGIVHSHLGLVAPFLLGILIGSRWRRQGDLLHTLRARALYPLALCAALYVLYTAMVALGWSTSRERALDYWGKEIWLFLVPLCFFIYSGASQRLMRDFWMSALRIGWIYIVTVLTFFYALLISCGSSPLITLTLSKYYLHDAGFVISTTHMLMPFTFTHYTYLGVFLLTPIVMTIRSSSRSLRLQAECLLLGVILYACALQARYLLLMALLLVAYTVACKLLDWGGITRRQPNLMPYLMLAGASRFTCVYTTSPNLVGGYLGGGIRNDLLQMSYQALREVPIWIGGGLDYVYQLLLPLPINAEQENSIIHFHNQYMQSLVQSGIIGLLLWISILSSMFWIARRQRNRALVVLTALWVILCNVDLVSYMSNYFIGMMFVLCLALSTQGDDKLQLAD